MIENTFQKSTFYNVESVFIKKKTMTKKDI